MSLPYPTRRSVLVLRAVATIHPTNQPTDNQLLRSVPPTLAALRLLRAGCMSSRSPPLHHVSTCQTKHPERCSNTARVIGTGPSFYHTSRALMTAATATGQESLRAGFYSCTQISSMTPSRRLPSTLRSPEAPRGLTSCGLFLLNHLRQANENCIFIWARARNEIRSNVIE